MSALSPRVFVALTPENKQLYDGTDTVMVSDEYTELRDRPEKLARRLAWLFLERCDGHLADHPGRDNIRWRPLRPTPALSPTPVLSE